MKIIIKYINKLQILDSLEKIKKVNPLICIQRSSTFEFCCYVLENNENEI